MTKGRFRSIGRESDWESDDFGNEEDAFAEHDRDSGFDRDHNQRAHSDGEAGDSQTDYNLSDADQASDGTVSKTKRAYGGSGLPGFNVGRNKETVAAILLLSTLLLTVIGVLGFHKGIERKLESSTLKALLIDNHREVSVSASGRDLTLRGLVESEDVLQQVTKLAEGRPGVRSVDVSKVVVTGGLNPAGSDTSGIDPGASDGSDATSSEVDSSASSGTSAGDPTLPVKKPIVDASFSAQTVEIRGIAPDSDARDVVVAPVADVLGVSLDSSGSGSTVPAVDGQRVLGNNVEVNLAPTERPDMPAYRRLGQFLQLLTRTNYAGSVRYDRGAMVLEGMVPLAADRVLIEAQARTLIGGGSLTMKLNPVPSDTALGLASTVPGEPPTTVGIAVTTTVSETELKTAQASIDASISGRTIEFEKEKAVLSAAGKTVVKELALAIKGLPNQALLITIAGYTDDRGSESSNLQLSQRRADAVAAQLLAEGMVTSQLKAEGRGEADPIASNETEEGRSKNRRIEIRVS